MRRTPTSRLLMLLGEHPLSRPRWIDLADRLRLLIIDGRLPRDSRLPGERDLAHGLGCARITVSAAYQRLRDEGHLMARRGVGHVVALPTIPIGRALPDPFDSPPGLIGLSTAATQAPTQLPRLLADLAAQLAEPGAGLGSGYHPDGLPVLRERLAASYADRGLPTDPDQIIVTNGALAALHLIATHLTQGRDRVLLEETSYSNAIEGLRRRGLRPYGFGHRRGGWDLDHLRQALTAQPALTYVIADFHNPTGTLIDDQDRAALGALTRRHRTRLVIDETMREVNLDGVAMPAPVARYDPTALTMGSASKSLWGGLRIGWIRAPHDLVRGLVETRSVLDLSSPVLDQLLVATLLGGAGPAPEAGISRYLQIVRTQQDLHRARRDHLVRLLHHYLPQWRFTAPAGGLALWITLPRPVSTPLVVAAERRGVVLTAGPRFHVESGGERHLRLPYVADPQTLSQAVAVLATIWPAVEAGGGDRPRGRLSA